MTRKKSFKKLAILFVKIDEYEKSKLERVADSKGFSNLSEFVRFELRKIADKYESKHE